MYISFQSTNFPHKIHTFFLDQERIFFSLNQSCLETNFYIKAPKENTGDIL